MTLDTLDVWYLVRFPTGAYVTDYYYLEPDGWEPILGRFSEEATFPSLEEAQEIADKLQEYDVVPVISLPEQEPVFA